VLKRAVERYPGIRTQAITCARHADIVGVLRACRAGSVSIELDMFHPDDAKALHDAGVSRPRSEVLAEYRGSRARLDCSRASVILSPKLSRIAEELPRRRGEGRRTPEKSDRDVAAGVERELEVSRGTRSMGRGPRGHGNG
jgi:hypothetical protein